MKLQPDPLTVQSAAIKVMGIGGGGCNAIQQMIDTNIKGAQFICANTDYQALARLTTTDTIQLGAEITKGFGTGADPEVGRSAAEHDCDTIVKALRGAEFLFLTGGMGGGTGTGAIPVIAKIAREMNILTVAVVTEPFLFEGSQRIQTARNGIAELRECVDSLIIVPNEKLLAVHGPDISLLQAFSASNEVLTNAVQNIVELINSPGLINIDFADIRFVVAGAGETIISSGTASGKHRVRNAVYSATRAPMYDDINIADAGGVLANIVAGSSLSLQEFQTAGDLIHSITASDANIIIGTSIDPEMEDEVRVTLVATRLSKESQASPIVTYVSNDTIAKNEDSMPTSRATMPHPAREETLHKAQTEIERIQSHLFQEHEQKFAIERQSIRNKDHSSRFFFTTVGLTVLSLTALFALIWGPTGMLS